MFHSVVYGYSCVTLPDYNKPFSGSPTAVFNFLMRIMDQYQKVFSLNHFSIVYIYHGITFCLVSEKLYDQVNYKENY